ncbi:hypothetical protein OROGR_014235 [Orobanche gracilis]
MAYFHFLAAPIFIALAILTLPSHQQSLETPSTISAAPALLPALPYTSELSPDTAPLLPSPAGPALSAMPTIPSSHTLNPDTIASVGPDSAIAPTGGPMQESSAVSRVLVDGLIGSSVFTGFLAYWFVMFIMV